jgi:predicted phosphodiesterase
MGKRTAEPTAKQRAIAALLKKHPDAGHRTLAKKLHDDNPALFPTLENARTAVRGYSGNLGAKSRTANKNQGRAIRPPRKPGELPPLPKSEAKPWEPYKIDAKRVLVLSDVHLPYHDEIAVDAALAYGDEFQPDAILINGDLFDFYMGSRFDQDPTKPKIIAELAAGKLFFSHIKARFDVPIFYKLGNHDERWNKYLALQAPALFDIEEVRNAWHIPAGIIDNGVKVIGEQRPVMLGNLMVLHGHEKGRGISSPVNPARGAFMRLLASVLEGHGHRQSEHSERTADGKEIVCRTTGCLCGLWPDYAKINKWSLGFATVEVEANKEYRVELKRIIEGQVF